MTQYTFMIGFLYTEKPCADFYPAQHDSNVQTWASHTVGIITYYLKGYHLLNLIFESIIKFIQGVLK
jgi:hypothetical protein